MVFKSKGFSIKTAEESRSIKLRFNYGAGKNLELLKNAASRLIARVCFRLTYVHLSLYNEDDEKEKYYNRRLGANGSERI